MRRVRCPHCGAENPESPIVTICRQCAGSLLGAEPADEAAAKAPPAKTGRRLVSVVETPAPAPEAETVLPPVLDEDRLPPRRAPSAPPPPQPQEDVFPRAPAAPAAATAPPLPPPPPLGTTPTIPPVAAAVEPPPVAPPRPTRRVVPGVPARACPQCGAANLPPNVRCFRCGSELPPVAPTPPSDELRTCPRCGLRQSAQSITCERCGLHFADVKRVLSTLPGRPGSYRGTAARSDQLVLGFITCAVVGIIGFMLLMIVLGAFVGR